MRTLARKLELEKKSGTDVTLESEVHNHKKRDCSAMLLYPSSTVVVTADRI